MPFGYPKWVGGWIILTKDRAIGRNSLEQVALLRSNTHCFILTSADQTGAEMAQAFVAALHPMKRLVAKFSAPFVGTVTARGVVRVLYTHDRLLADLADDLGP